MVRNTYLSYERLSLYNIAALVFDGYWLVVRSVIYMRGYMSQSQKRFLVISHVTMCIGKTPGSRCTKTLLRYTC